MRAFYTDHKSRIFQLIQKTNQFNLTTKRWDLPEIEGIMGSDSWITVESSLRDKFGDNGIVSLIAGELDSQGHCHVRLWLMSCRVFGRNLEHAMMDQFLSRCKSQKIAKIRGYYIPSKANLLVKNTFDEFGFELINESETESIWELKPELYSPKNNVIEVIYESA